MLIRQTLLSRFCQRVRCACEASNLGERWMRRREERHCDTSGDTRQLSTNVMSMKDK